MKKTVLTFGLMAGGVLSVVMMVTLPFENEFSGVAEIVGYATMVLSFLLVFFGIRSYRDTVGNGSVSFGRAFTIGVLITAVASVCYTATWEVIYFKFRAYPDFTAKYTAQQVEKARASGASQAQIDAKLAEMKAFAVRFENPVFNSAMTLMEPLPVGLIIALVSAGVLRRRRRDGTPAMSVSVA